jgi:hypothetical protein
MIGGQGYQVARPPFVVSRPVSSALARGPPDAAMSRQPGPVTTPETPQGQR